MEQHKTPAQETGLAFCVAGPGARRGHQRLVRSLWLDIYFIPSASMEPLLHTGDRILVSRTDFQSEPIRPGRRRGL